MRQARWLGPALVLPLFACGARTGVSFEDDGPGPGRDGRFVGTWLVDQPAHALYEYTLYTFGADGTLERGAACDETGWVQQASSDLRCTFADAWESRGDAMLAIVGACSDGQERTIELGFLSPPEANTDGATVAVTAVGGETGWGHEWPTWSWQRCLDVATCEPISSCPHGSPGGG